MHHLRSTAYSLLEINATMPRRLRPPAQLPQPIRLSSPCPSFLSCCVCHPLAAFTSLLTMSLFLVLLCLPSTRNLYVSPHHVPLSCPAVFAIHSQPLRLSSPCPSFLSCCVCHLLATFTSLLTMSLFLVLLCLPSTRSLYVSPHHVPLSCPAVFAIHSQPLHLSSPCPSFLSCCVCHPLAAFTSLLTMSLFLVLLCLPSTRSLYISPHHVPLSCPAVFAIHSQPPLRLLNRITFLSTHNMHEPPLSDLSVEVRRILIHGWSHTVGNINKLGMLVAYFDDVYCINNLKYRTRQANSAPICAEARTLHKSVRVCKTFVRKHVHYINQYASVKHLCGSTYTT